MSKIVKGIEASPGIAIGKIFLYQENELVIDEKKKCDSDCEKERLLSGREKAKEQLLRIREKTAPTVAISFFPYFTTILRASGVNRMIGIMANIDTSPEICTLWK